MIDPATINPIALPSVPLEDRLQLPTKPCIYFAIDSQDVVQYIGRSINPRHRWKNHHRHNDLESIGGVRIAYLTVDANLLNDVESSLIKWFKPPMNRQSVLVQSPGEGKVLRVPGPLVEDIEALITLCNYGAKVDAAREHLRQTLGQKLAQEVA